MLSWYDCGCGGNPPLYTAYVVGLVMVEESITFCVKAVMLLVFTVLDGGYRFACGFVVTYAYNVHSVLRTHSTDRTVSYSSRTHLIYDMRSSFYAYK